MERKVLDISVLSGLSPLRPLDGVSVFVPSAGFVGGGGIQDSVDGTT